MGSDLLYLVLDRDGRAVARFRDARDAAAWREAHEPLGQTVVLRDPPMSAETHAPGDGPVWPLFEVRTGDAAREVLGRFVWMGKPLLPEVVL
jgi:hypothetical protein